MLCCHIWWWILAELIPVGLPEEPWVESAENVDQLSCQVACSRVLQWEVACLHLGDCVKRHLHGYPRGEVNSHVSSGSVNSHPECGCLHVGAWKWGRKPHPFITCQWGELWGLLWGWRALGAFNEQLSAFIDELDWGWNCPRRTMGRFSLDFKRG